MEDEIVDQQLPGGRNVTRLADQDDLSAGMRTRFYEVCGMGIGNGDSVDEAGYSRMTWEITTSQDVKARNVQSASSPSSTITPDTQLLEAMFFEYIKNSETAKADLSKSETGRMLLQQLDRQKNSPVTPAPSG